MPQNTATLVIPLAAEGCHVAGKIPDRATDLGPPSRRMTTPVPCLRLTISAHLPIYRIKFGGCPFVTDVRTWPNSKDVAPTLTRRRCVDGCTPELIVGPGTTSSSIFAEPDKTHCTVKRMGTDFGPTTKLECISAGVPASSTEPTRSKRHSQNALSSRRARCCPKHT